jgi:hypothetical protein
MTVKIFVILLTTSMQMRGEYLELEYDLTSYPLPFGTRYTSFHPALCNASYRNCRHRNTKCKQINQEYKTIKRKDLDCSILDSDTAQSLSFLRFNTKVGGSHFASTCHPPVRMHGVLTHKIWAAKIFHQFISYLKILDARKGTWSKVS